MACVRTMSIVVHKIGMTIPQPDVVRRVDAYSINAKHSFKGWRWTPNQTLRVDSAELAHVRRGSVC
jgi:hypothetical protein